MRFLRALLGVAALLLFVAGLDVASRILAEDRIEAKARAEVPEAGRVEAHIDSFPFLARLLSSGSVGDVALHLDQVPTRAARLTAVDMDLSDVEVDRDALLSRQISVNSIDRGTVAVELDAAALSGALRVPVSIAGGEVRSKVGPLNVSARPSVGDDGALLLRLGSLRLRLSLPRGKLQACVATRVAVVDDRVRLSCELDEVPAAVRRR